MEAKFIDSGADVEFILG